MKSAIEDDEEVRRKKRSEAHKERALSLSLIWLEDGLIDRTGRQQFDQSTFSCLDQNLSEPHKEFE